LKDDFIENKIKFETPAAAGVILNVWTTTMRWQMKT
jgi:hypothetical protein